MEHWATVKRIHQATLEREVDQRAGFLDQACCGDEGLRREVESLLAYGPAAEAFMELPALEVNHDVCAHEAHIGVVRYVPTSVPKRGPRNIIRQPTPTKL